MQKKNSVSKAEASSRKAKLTASIENNEVKIKGKGKVLQAIVLENELTNHSMAFPMKMLMCYRQIAEKNSEAIADSPQLLDSMVALGELVQAALCECGGFDESDVYAIE